MTTVNVEINTVNYRGDMFDRFYARKDPHSAPGWFVFGRNPGYGDHYIMLCARPAVKARKHPHYNVAVRRGWSTKREAESIAAELNQRAADCAAFLTA